MNPIPDDPRWTAYLLGELETEERGACEAYLRDHPEAVGAIDDLRATARMIREALQAEPAPEVSPALREAVRTQLSQPEAESESRAQSQARPAIMSWRPKLLRLCAGVVSVAAGLAVIALSLDRWKIDPHAENAAAVRHAGRAPAASAPADDAPAIVAQARSAGAPRDGEADVLRDGESLERQLAKGVVPKAESGIDLAAVGRSPADLKARGMILAEPAPAASEAKTATELAYGIAEAAAAPAADAPAPVPATALAGVPGSARGQGTEAPPRGERRPGVPPADAEGVPPPAAAPPGAVSPPADKIDRMDPAGSKRETPPAEVLRADSAPALPPSAGEPAVARFSEFQSNAPAGAGKPEQMNRRRMAGAAADPSAARGGMMGGVGGGRGTTGGTPRSAGGGASETRGRANTRDDDMYMQQLRGVQGLAGGLGAKESKDARGPSMGRAKQTGGDAPAQPGQAAAPSGPPAKQPRSEEDSQKPAEHKLAELAAQDHNRLGVEVQLQDEQLAKLKQQAEQAKEVEVAQEARRLDLGGDVFQEIVDNPFIAAAQEPTSTFSVDVDTAAYTYIRRMLQQGALPPRDAVRIEEMVNFFTYDDPAPDPGADPIAIRAELAECPWNRVHALLRVNLKTRPVDVASRPRANLVFLVDVSGSMDQPDKLPLVKASLRMLAHQLGENDKVAIVVYAGNAGLVLNSTSGLRRHEIASAIDQLEAGGSTNGGEGIRLAYDLARKHFVPGGQNRVILATDGDFNVGVTDREALVQLVAEQAKNQIFLNVLSVGQGNLKDATMEQIADKGNGAYAHLDSLDEARRVLVEQIGGTLVTVAKDVKLQLQFNPARVRQYRLIGYENRKLANEDFADDRKDAGEMGAGHAVTAFYELQLDQDPAGAIGQKQLIEDVVQVRVRYQPPAGGSSKLIEASVADLPKPYPLATADFRFGAAVASFGMLLRQSPHRGNANLDAVAELAGAALGPDKAGYRKEFVDLVKRARELSPAAGGGPALAAPGGLEVPLAAPAAAPAPAPTEAPAPAPAPANPPR